MANTHGGRRPKAGRPRKSSHLRGLDGGAGRRPVKGASAEPTVTSEVEEFDAPDVLTLEQRHVWMELAPHAFKQRTLDKARMAAFVLLCKNYELERRMSADSRAGTADHRGMIQRVQSDLSAFDLRPCGKAIYEAAGQPSQKPASPLTRFLKRG